MLENKKIVEDYFDNVSDWWNWNSKAKNWS